MTLQEEYNAKLMSPEQIAGNIAPNSTICSDNALSLPPAITSAIAERARAGEVAGLKQHTTLDLWPVPCYDQDLAGKYSGISWFSGGKARKAVNNGYGDLFPAYYRDFPRLYSEYISVDYLILAVSPMSEDGYFSAGCTGSAIDALLNKAGHVYLEVNSFMPYSPTAPLIHLSRVDGFCVNDHPLPVLPESKIDPVSKAIGDYIAERIPDGATLQLGIGAIPDAVGTALKTKKHLGLHTEMFTDSMVELIQCGAVDNSAKPIHPGKSVAAFAFGSQRIYDYIDHNPDIELLSVDHVNNPVIIAQHPNFVSVNAALEVDFYGQVCAESIGTRHFSGTGGQADFVRGANLSENGQSFIAFASTTADGTVSKIRPTLTPGAIVSTTKNDVDCIVTEYGVAKLRGHTLSERTKALISIAHPDFRDELTFEAKKLHILI